MEGRAERAPSDEARQAWLTLAETYATLLMLEKVELTGALISGKRLGLPRSAGHALSKRHLMSEMIRNREFLGLLF